MTTVRGKLRNENRRILLKDNKEEIDWTLWWKEFQNIGATTQIAYSLVNLKWTFPSRNYKNSLFAECSSYIWEKRLAILWFIWNDGYAEFGKGNYWEQLPYILVKINVIWSHQNILKGFFIVKSLVPWASLFACRYFIIWLGNIIISFCISFTGISTLTLLQQSKATNWSSFTKWL